MADYGGGEASEEKRPSTIGEVQRLCKMRMEQLSAEMAEMDEASKRLDMQRLRLVEERRQVEAVLDATRGNEPPRDIVRPYGPNVMPSSGGFRVTS